MHQRLTMNKNLKNTIIATRLITLLWFIVLFSGSIMAQDATITIHLRGVYESKISLLPLSGTNTLKPVNTVDSVKNGKTATIHVSRDNLPGEFVLRFDYKQNSASTPYPSEKRIIINNQDLQLWVNPVYCNNTDSTWFQKEEKENTVYSRFLQENTRQKTTLGLLQNFLLNYDDTNSSFYKEGITEYEKRRKAFNQWITQQTQQNMILFVSSMFGFQHLPQIDWKGSEADRKRSLRENYFNGMDLSNPLVTKTTGMKDWMDGYVNLYGELATNVIRRDSLFTLAGKTAIEKVRTGNPIVYGWMVDYFFKGYESFNIEKGLKMLQPYLDDPNCLTTKRQEINKRLKGIETLVPGTKAPNIVMQDAVNKPFELDKYQTDKKYILLFFWSADCGHCTETVGKLYPWYQNAEINKRLDVVAISVDETNTEIQAWQQKIIELKGWIHMRAPEGVRSKVANDYFILSTPIMILLNSKTKEIISMPDTAEELQKLLST